MGAPDGPFVFRASEPQTLSGDQVLSLTPTALSFFLVAHLVGMTLTGLGFESFLRRS